jgi:hypothetical protein
LSPTSRFILLLITAPVTARGQGAGAQFEFQPGLQSTDLVSAPSGISSATGFNLRIATRFPTRNRWFTPVVGASVEPYGSSDVNDRNANAPRLFIGNVFPVVDSSGTRGWATVELPLLVYHEYGGGGASSRRLYGRDLYGQLAVYVHLGQKVLRSLGAAWAQLDFYGFLEQNLTPNRNVVTGRVDRFNPVVLYGVSIPVGSPGGGR